jgi:hypothetical protein
MPVMVVELQERLLVQEREHALMAREDDFVAAEHALGRAHMECDNERDWAKASRWDYWTRLCASTVGQQCSLDFDWVLCERWFLLSMGEMDLEQREEKLDEEQA